MTLSEYVLKERGRLARVARDVGIAPAFLAQIASGRRKAPVQYCRAIVDACHGEVSLRDLRPADCELIWPELTAPGVVSQVRPPAVATAAPAAQTEETRDAA